MRLGTAFSSGGFPFGSLQPKRHQGRAAGDAEEGVKVGHVLVQGGPFPPECGGDLIFGPTGEEALQDLPLHGAEGLVAREQAVGEEETAVQEGNPPQGMAD